MSKIISVNDEVYKRLKHMKGKESFSEIIIELLQKSSNKNKILSFGGRGEFDDEKLEDLRKGWKKWRERYA